MIITAFILFVFTTLGIGMLVLTQVHLRLCGFRRNSTLLDYASENGIKESLYYLMEEAERSPSFHVISEEKFNELKENARSKGNSMAEEILRVAFPLFVEGNGGALVWKAQTSCSLEKVEEKENFILARFIIPINSEGALSNFRPKRKSSLESLTGIFAGHVPLPLLPFLLEKELTDEEKERFEEESEVVFVPSGANRIPPRISFSEGGIMPDDTTPLLEKALKIKIFYPQKLTNAELRFALGLEAGDDPVPPGVYLIQDDLGLGGVYIQGDLDEMIPAVEEDFQVIFFRMGEDIWVLKFSPSRSETIFQTPEDVLHYDFTPLGIIVVNGKIHSLGGGAVDAEGQIYLVQDEEIPSLLQGVNLTLVASERITISSHLIRQGVDWQDGIPYLKDTNQQLIIFSTGLDFLQEIEREGGITVAENSPSLLRIQASLTARGTGFTVEGEGKTLSLLGSLQTVDYLAEGNRLHLTPSPPPRTLSSFSAEAPVTKEPVLFLSFFEVMEWKEY